MDNAPTPTPNRLAPIKVFVMKFTEAEAQQALNVFEWTVRNGGLPLAKEVLPLAEKFMNAAVKAKQAEDAAKKAQAAETKAEEPATN